MSEDNQGDLWEVFIQGKPGRPHKHVGSLHAYDKEMAMKSARDLYTRRQEGVGIWIVSAPQAVCTSRNLLPWTPPPLSILRDWQHWDQDTKLTIGCEG